ncbi:hypothetical protein Pint_07559 [Pistacia integerrima]|uniref:Uncharacterized protein n=1 Tax=Pistacia integerrima TaxID=434235 RepID=A0ACC0XYD5_9ROSI|nr:hypothetical protein Pint_07559 [Pistacia integerrima]
MHTSAFASMLYSVDLTYLHVLVVPKREVKRVFDLTADETSDLWLSAQCFYLSKMSSMDRPEAEQSVPHVHIHILPRKSGDFERNDENRWEGEGIVAEARFRQGEEGQKLRGDYTRGK